MHSTKDMVRHAAAVATQNAPGTLVAIQEEREGLAFSSPTPEVFEITELKLRYTIADIPEVPTQQYTSKDFRSLPTDWESSDFFRVKGVPIPIRFWSQLFQNKPSIEFSKRKEIWRKWKVS